MAKSSKPKKGAITSKKKKADPFKNKGEHPLKKERCKKAADPGECKPVDPAVLNARLGVEAMTGQKISEYLGDSRPISEAEAHSIIGLTKGGSESEASFKARQEHARKFYDSLQSPNGIMTADGNVRPITRSELEDYIKGGNVVYAYPEVKKEFTGKERAFIWEYITNGYNKTQAAKDAGYDANSDNCFAAIGYENFRKPHIKAEIERLISERLMSKEETLQRMSQMARGNLNDYLHVVHKKTRPVVKVSLNVLIERNNAKIEDQAKFIERARIKVGSARMSGLCELKEQWEEEVIKWGIELERNPGAYVEEKGDEVTEEVIELDLVKLMKDKERGLIKKLTQDKNGNWEVELYGSDGALRDIGRYHGIFEKDNRRLNLNSEPLTDDEIVRLAKKLDSEY